MITSEDGRWPGFIWKNKCIILAVLLCCAFFITGIFNLSQYGEAADEPMSRARGNLTLSYTISFFTPDKSNDVTLSHKQYEYHPSTYAAVNYLIGKFLQKLGVEQIQSYHAVNLFLATMGLLLLFFLTRMLFNERAAVFSVLLLCLFPRFAAHAHYNDKDIAVMVFCINAIYLIYKANQSKRLLFSILAGIATALAVSVKLDGLFILPIIFFAIILSGFIAKEKICFRTALPKSLAYFISFSIGIYLLWPYLWRNPFFIVESVEHFSGVFLLASTRFFGKTYLANDAPWHYYTTFLLITTPLATLVLFCVGIYSAANNLIKRRKAFEYLLIIFWILVPLAVRSLPQFEKYNGMRHVFIVVPAVMIFAGLGVEEILANIRKLSRARIVEIASCTILIFIILTSLTFELVQAHPFETVYFNEGIRLLKPNHLEQYFDLDEWGSSYPAGVKWINENADKESTVCLLVFGNLVKNNMLRPDLKINCNEPDYAMGLTSYDNMDKFLAKYPKNKISLEYSVSRFNSDIIRIYKIKK